MASNAHLGLAVGSRSPKNRVPAGPDSVLKVEGRNVKKLSPKSNEEDGFFTREVVMQDAANGVQIYTQVSTLRKKKGPARTT